MLSHELLNYLTFKLFYLLPMANRYIYIYIYIYIKLATTLMSIAICNCGHQETRRPWYLLLSEAKSRQNESQSISPLKCARFIVRQARQKMRYNVRKLNNLLCTTSYSDQV